MDTLVRCVCATMGSIRGLFPRSRNMSICMWAAMRAKLIWAALNRRSAQLYVTNLRYIRRRTSICPRISSLEDWTHDLLVSLLDSGSPVITECSVLAAASDCAIQDAMSLRVRRTSGWSGPSTRT